VFYERASSRRERYRSALLVDPNSRSLALPLGHTQGSTSDHGGSGANDNTDGGPTMQKAASIFVPAFHEVGRGGGRNASQAHDDPYWDVIQHSRKHQNDVNRKRSTAAGSVHKKQRNCKLALRAEARHGSASVSVSGGRSKCVPTKKMTELVRQHLKFDAMNQRRSASLGPVAARSSGSEAPSKISDSPVSLMAKKTMVRAKAAKLEDFRLAKKAKPRRQTSHPSPGSEIIVIDD
jgi:hypothetical protein